MLAEGSQRLAGQPLPFPMDHTTAWWAEPRHPPASCLPAMGSQWGRGLSVNAAGTPDPGSPWGRCPILPALSLLGQHAWGRLVLGPPEATSFASHTVLGGVAGWGPCGESVAAVGEGTGAGVGGGSGGGVGFCGLCSELPPRTPTSLGPDNSHSATRHSLLRAQAAAATATAGGKSTEELTAEDTLFLGAGLANVRGKGQGACKKAGEKEPGSQMDPFTAEAWGPNDRSGGSTARLCSLKGEWEWAPAPRGVAAGGWTSGFPGGQGLASGSPRNTGELVAWLSKVLRARKWYPVNHPGKKGEVGDGGQVLDEAGAKGQGKCPDRKCAKWRQAGREGRRVMARGGSLCTRQPQWGYWGL